MNQEEKIYQKIKNASHKTEETSFPGMDKVWNRVEEKLDTKVIKKKSEVWKKLAIAASFLLFFTVGIQLFTTQKELTKPIEPQINVESSSEQVQDNLEYNVEAEKKQNVETSAESETKVSSNSLIVMPTKTKEVIVESIKPSPIIKENIHYEKAKTSFAAEEITADVTFISQEDAIAKGHYNSSSSNNVFYPSKGRIFAARSSNMKYELQIDEKEAKIQSKSDDLVLINGKLSSKKREDLSSSERDEMVELKNPVYIINGEEFSEESLFGEKPTSKYAPLTKQKIDSIKVYLPDEAKPIYGKKGENGVVIISIKK